MATTERKAHPGALTEEEFLATVEAGIFYDRLDSYAPPETYGPPTKAELAAARRPRKSDFNSPARHRDGVAASTMQTARARRAK
jgi:hypothetical protein